VLPSLPSAYLEHLTAPRNRGDLEPADAVGEAGTPVAGTGVRITLRIRRRFLRTRRIAEARFRVLGGSAAIAPASWLTERVLGSTVAEARALGVEDVARALGGPPRGVVEASRLVVRALASALEDRGGPRGEDRGILVCRCFLVGDRRIREAARAGASTVPEVAESTSAGRGCHSCWPDVLALLDEERHPTPPPVDRGAAPVLQVVEAVVRPAWRALGVHLGRAEVDGEVVRLEVARADPGALSSPIGAIAIARRHLADVVSDAVRVEAW
jgi:NifU-like protein involved in Fe-S cluster formation/bacterioferritin-associated ferredoxin